VGKLEGKAAIVTGGGQGLGAGVAERFAREGARVLVADLLGDRAKDVAAALGGESFAMQVDVSEESQVAEMVDTAVERFGGLDVMVNNAGVLGPIGSIADIAVADFDRTVAVHLRGVFLGIKHAVRVFRERGGGGVILNTASTAGVQGGLGPHAYTAAKHAVVGLTKSAAAELVSDGIRVNAIAPGMHVTPMVIKLLTGSEDQAEAAERIMAERSPQGRAPYPEDIAGAYVYLAADEAWFANGACLVVDGAREVLAYYPLGITRQ
jgi:NAD(P)-dependent dehydrogenase (short-subunit alcohol dehydrogenase family)